LRPSRPHYAFRRYLAQSDDPDFGVQELLPLSVALLAAPLELWSAATPGLSAVQGCRRA